MVPTGSQPVAEVVIGREVEETGAWLFDVTIRRGQAESQHRLRLAWADYEYWSHGSTAPERVAKAVVESVLELAPDREVPAKFDAAAGRRWATGATFDERVRERLG
jgi:hypothetical protein